MKYTIGQFIFASLKEIKPDEEICTFLSNACSISLKWNNTMSCHYTLDVLYLRIIDTLEKLEIIYRI